MYALLLLLIAVDAPKKPFDFAKDKPAAAPVVAEEKPVEVKVDWEARYDAEHEKLTLLEEAQTESEQRITNLVATNRELQAMIEHLKKQLAEPPLPVEKLAGSNGQPPIEPPHFETEAPPIDVTGWASQIQELRPNVQIWIWTSPACGACPGFINTLRAALPANMGWHIGHDVGSNIYIHEISQAEWNQRGLTLPFVEVVSRGVRKSLGNRVSANTIAAEYNAAFEADKQLPQLAGEHVASIGVATINGKQQVMQLLTMLEPFLDGGKLTLEYTPKPGIIKQYLTIKQGPAQIKIPTKTSFTLQMHDGDLTVLCNEPKVQIVLMGMQRGIQEVDVTPNKISLRLPWMIDPELNLK